MTALSGFRRGAPPEAEIQRAIVTALRLALPRGAIVHHVANEVAAGGAAARKRQAILVGMGLHPGFSDLVVLAEGRVLFLEVKAPDGRLRPDQADFRDAVRAQGFAWELARSIDDALDAHGFATRIRRGW
jgi:hypothetical protein